MKLHCIIVVAFLMLSGYAYSQMPPTEPGVSHDLAIWRAARYSDVRYKLNLTLEKMSPVLKGTIEVRVNVTAPRPADAMYAGSRRSDEVPPIVLDWRNIRGSESLSTISNVSINGSGVVSFGLSRPSAEQKPPKGETQNTYEEVNEHLIFRQGVKAGENVIKLDFTSPILTSGSAITRYVDKEDGAEYIYSLFVPSDASTAFPVFDQPDLKARFTLDIRMPTRWKAISNEKWNGIITQRQCERLPPSQRFTGILVPIGKKEKRKKQFVQSKPTGVQTESAENLDPCNMNEFGFNESKPISTYVFAFAAGPWEEVSVPPAVAGGTDLPTHIYVRKSQAEKFQPHAAEVFRLNREGIKYLEEYFDYKFPFPKYDIVLIPEFPFGGMEHAGATFLRESSIIFPSEPTANDYISRANVIFHEAAHQWFGDTVTMRWFDDLWLKEGFAEFMAYKALERVMRQYNAWKAFYERNKQAAYLTDSTKGTTPIYQEIPNLSAAKSAYGNIVYRKAPSFLRQAEFFLGKDKFQPDLHAFVTDDKFQIAVRSFLKKYAFSNADWQDLVQEFEIASGRKDLKDWANNWVKVPGLTIFRQKRYSKGVTAFLVTETPEDSRGVPIDRHVTTLHVSIFSNGTREPQKYGRTTLPGIKEGWIYFYSGGSGASAELTVPFFFPNYQDYGYGIFLLDDKSRDYVLKNIQNEKDDFLRSMMWGALWDSVREGELDPREYVELATKNMGVEKDELTIQTILGRVSMTMTYYLSEKQKANLIGPLEDLLVDKMTTSKTLGLRMTFFRAYLNIASTEKAAMVLKELLELNKTGTPNQVDDVKKDINNKTDGLFGIRTPLLRTKDRFDIVTRLAILNDPDAATLLADLEKTETSDDAKRYAYAAHAAFPNKENREKFWNDFVNNKDISESWIESAMIPFNSPRHSELSLPYLQKALAELPNLKRSRKIFFVNGWLGAFIGGQKSQAALDIVNKFIADNPNLDHDLRLKILENVDMIERAVRIRGKYGKN